MALQEAWADLYRQIVETDWKALLCLYGHASPSTTVSEDLPGLPRTGSYPRPGPDQTYPGQRPVSSPPRSSRYCSSADPSSPHPEGSPPSDHGPSEAPLEHTPRRRDPQPE